MATGPDAERAIEIVAEIAPDPPPIHESTFGYFILGVFSQREEE